MKRLAAAYNDETLWWRGSDERWFEVSPPTMRRLLSEFVSGPYPNAEFATQIADALAQFEADRDREEAA